MTHTTNQATTHQTYQATYETRCDGACHEANLADCDLCDALTWELMCDECRSYAAMDCDPETDPHSDPESDFEVGPGGAAATGAGVA